MLAYFNDYVDTDLRQQITFNTYVEDARRDAAISGMFRYRLARSGYMTHRWLLMVIIGIVKFNRIRRPLQRHTDAQPAYDSPFEPHDLRGKTFSLLVFAIPPWILPQKFRKNRLRRNVLCRRRGVWVLPKYLNGEPADKAVMPAWVPTAIAGSASVLSRAIGNMENYGLPPDHKVLTAHPSVSGEFLTRGMRRHFG